MAEPTNDDAAKALERLTSPQGPTPQPKPRVAAVVKPQVKPQVARPTAPSARPSSPATRAPVAKTPVAKKAPAPPPMDVGQALAGTSSKLGMRAAKRQKSDPAPFQLALKRTVIPVLLTMGFILVSLAVVHYAWRSDDNPVLELPTAVIIGMMAGALVLWALAALNMVSVRRTLAARSQTR